MVSILAWHHSHRRPSLNDARDRLDQAKENSQEQDQGRDPKRVPLNLFPIVIPRQRQRMRLGFIKRLFQYHEAVPPVCEVFNLPRRGVQGAVCAGFGVEGEVGLFFLEPGF